MTTELLAFALFVVLFSVAIVLDNREYLRVKHDDDDD